jgi:hypothetical protein
MIKHDQALDNFIASLDEARFYDAHEDLEEIWFPRRFEDNDEVKLLKGFINAAVSFELIKKGRIQAGEKVWKNYLKYLPLLETINSKFTTKYNQIALHVEKVKDFNNK